MLTQIKPRLLNKLMIIWGEDIPYDLSFCSLPTIFSGVHYPLAAPFLQQCKSWKAKNLQNPRHCDVMGGWWLTGPIKKELGRNNSVIPINWELTAREWKEQEEGKRVFTGSVWVSAEVGLDTADSFQLLKDLKRALGIWTKYKQKCFDGGKGIAF